MSTNPTYLFESERLGFRNWSAADVDAMAEINQDKAVMAFFPSLASREQTIAFIHRMQNHFENKGFCYFAVDALDKGEFIGFIGLLEQIYEADFTPCVDIGWRLGTWAWNRGFATEGAKRCLAFAFNELNLEIVNAIAPKINEKSIQVMRKIGMKKVGDFEHPLLLEDERLKLCVLYETSNRIKWQSRR